MYWGVSLQLNLSWNIHINSIISKANKTRVMFLRLNLTISSSTINFKERACKAFVRAVLEYAYTVWDPHTQLSIHRIKAKQCCAARFVLNRYHKTSSVNRMLNSLGWSSLAQQKKVTFCTR